MPDIHLYTDQGATEGRLIAAKFPSSGVFFFLYHAM